jgi:hypothetical protein
MPARGSSGVGNKQFEGRPRNRALALENLSSEHAREEYGRTLCQMRYAGVSELLAKGNREA